MFSSSRLMCVNPVTAMPPVTWAGSSCEQAFYCNLVGIPVVLLFTIITGELPGVLSYSSQNPNFLFLMTVPIHRLLTS